ncbi:hypothetical protein QZH41_016354, partial [Actinostola sp. cb2023]
NFANIIFATVANRDPDELSRGRVDVRFIEGQMVFGIELCQSDQYVMAESPAFFEAYRHVLAALQDMHEHNLPFQKYLVKCDPDVNAPAYLENDTVYDLSEALDVPDLEEARTVPLLKPEEWPDVENLPLNDSQFRALKTALTKEFSIIQGPPGTGKTYVGLKIVRCLINNSRVWNPDMESPILMVCFTNHALDQFLEGILDFREDGIIRVGSRCKSEKLERFNLKRAVRFSYQRRQSLRTLQEQKERIEDANDELQFVEKGDAIQAIKRLEKHNCIANDHLDSFYHNNLYNSDCKTEQDVFQLWICGTPNAKMPTLSTDNIPDEARCFVELEGAVGTTPNIAEAANQESENTLSRITCVAEQSDDDDLTGSGITPSDSRASTTRMTSSGNANCEDDEDYDWGVAPSNESTAVSDSDVQRYGIAPSNDCTAEIIENYENHGDDDESTAAMIDLDKATYNYHMEGTSPHDMQGISQEANKRQVVAVGATSDISQEENVYIGNHVIKDCQDHKSDNHISHGCYDGNTNSLDIAALEQVQLEVQEKDGDNTTVCNATNQQQRPSGIMNISNEDEDETASGGWTEVTMKRNTPPTGSSCETTKTPENGCANDCDLETISIQHELDIIQDARYIYGEEDLYLPITSTNENKEERIVEDNEAVRERFEETYVELESSKIETQSTMATTETLTIAGGFRNLNGMATDVGQEKPEHVEHRHNKETSKCYQEITGKSSKRKRKQQKNQIRKKLESAMKQIKSKDLTRMSEDEAESIGDIWSISHKDRLRLYLTWVVVLKENLQRNIIQEEQGYDAICKEIENKRAEEEEKILRNATVIGMTTTCAARYHAVLQRIKPKIVIIEEAAEVLEAHIITSLARDTEQVILIGDHKQLRPKPTEYKLAVNFNLDISLFERMVLNEMDCMTLSVQHRMRPEIAQLTKGIYDYEIQDDDSVNHFEDVQGLKTNLFFIDHRSVEQMVGGLQSYANPEEAKMVVSLCRFVELEECGHIIEVSRMDKWMSQPLDTEANPAEPRCCPVCSIPIYYSFRYGNTVREALQNMFASDYFSKTRTEQE